MNTSRRNILKGLGVAVALPWLETFAANSTPKSNRRFITVDLCLGLHPESFFPEGSGRAYKLSPYLEKIKQHRQDFTVFSGVKLPRVNGGHANFVSFLSGAPDAGSSSFKNSISLDQYAAARLGGDTRHSYMALTTKASTLSYSSTGIPIPADNSSSKIFKKLFLKGSKREIEQQLKKLDYGKSILDTVNQQAKKITQNVSARDKQKLDEYFTAVRETEKRVNKAEDWIHKPKPTVAIKEMKDKKLGDIVGRVTQMYDLMHLAVETDQTRFITLYIDGMNDVAPIKGVSAGYHNLSHHGKDPEKIKQLQLIEFELMRMFGDFLTKLKKSREGSGCLLDNTTVLFGSHMGNGNNHSSTNLPILLAGGKFKHGQHLAFDKKDNHPLSDIYVSILNGLGLKDKQFSSGTRPMKGLELV